MHTDTLNYAKTPELSSDAFSLDQTADDSCSVISSNGPMEDNFPKWKKSIIVKPKNAEGTHIFIVKRIDDEQSTALCLDVIRILGSYKTKVFVEEACFEELKTKDTHESKFHEFSGEEDDELSIDLLIVIGGDGSILWALKHFQNERAMPPVLAFSKGTLNYLCNFGLDNIEGTLRKIMESISCGKGIQVEERFRLQCEIFEKESGKKRTVQALNEIVLDRGMNPTIVRLDCKLEDKYFATFEGDGVMVATPTGSTAYQLSAGGPIMNHLNSSMAVTPIAPMNLSTRPVVLPNNIKLSFKLRDDSRKSAFLSADGQIRIEITKGTEVKVTGSQYAIPFILDEEKDTLDNWISRLRDLLGWNRKY